MSNGVKYDDISSVPNEYKPTIYKLDVSDKKVYDISPQMSSNIDYPVISLGFQQYLHANVDKMKIIKEFDGKKKVFSTMKLFNPIIYDYDAGIENVSEEYFKLTEHNKILGSGFYKLWEILPLFEIGNLNEQSFISAHLADNDYSFAQATIMYREMFAKKSHQKDKHYILAENTNTNSDNFIKSYGNKLSITYIPEKDNLITQKTIKSFSSEIEKKVDLVTSCGYSKWDYKITHEQDLIKPIIGETVCALNILNDGGCFICRTFETFTMTMCKMIYTIASMFKQVHIVKPLTSDASTSERFIVFQDYVPNQKRLEQFEKVLKICTDNPTLNVVSIFPDLNIPSDFHTSLLCANTDIANKQLLSINKIVSFIKSQNYYGDMYTSERLAQIGACTYWINVFYPNKGEHRKMLSILNNVVKSVLDTSAKNIQKMGKFV